MAFAPQIMPDFTGTIPLVAAIKGILDLLSINDVLLGPVRCQTWITGNGSMSIERGRGNGSTLQIGSTPWATL